MGTSCLPKGSDYITVSQCLVQTTHLKSVLSWTEKSTLDTNSRSFLGGKRD